MKKGSATWPSPSVFPGRSAAGGCAVDRHQTLGLVAWRTPLQRRFRDHHGHAPFPAGFLDADDLPDAVEVQRPARRVLELECEPDHLSALHLVADDKVDPARTDIPRHAGNV